MSPEARCRCELRGDLVAFLLLIDCDNHITVNQEHRTMGLIPTSSFRGQASNPLRAQRLPLIACHTNKNGALTGLNDLRGSWPPECSIHHS